VAAPLIPIVPGAVASAADDADAFEMKKDEAVPRQAGQTINFAQHYHHSGVAIDRPPAPVILGKAKGFTRLTDMKPGQLTLSFRFQEHVRHGRRIGYRIGDCHHAVTGRGEGDAMRY